MINQVDNFLWYKLNGFLRILLVHLMSDTLPIYIVTEIPKSGGTWLSQMLSAALGVPFPRNRLPMFGSSIIHGHYLYKGGMKNVIVLWRDIRDVLISMYYHCFYVNERHNAALVEETRRRLVFSDIDDVPGNLCKFIHYIFEEDGFGFSPMRFYAAWHNDRSVIHVKYEDLRKHTVKELLRIAGTLNCNLEVDKAGRIADEFSFVRQSGRKPGVVKRNSFMRSGVVGGWKNYFTSNARKLLDEYAGEYLIELGYEKDRSWVEQ